MKSRPTSRASPRCLPTAVCLVERKGAECLEWACPEWECRAWKEAEWKVRTAELSLRQGRTGGLPELMLTSRYTYNMQTNFEPGFKNIDFNVANVGLRLNVPLFQGNYYRAARHKSKLQLEQIIEQKSAERAAIQKEIQDINKKREFYIKEEKERKAKSDNNTQTLETEVEKIIREQAKRFNMKIE